MEPSELRACELTKIIQNDSLRFNVLFDQDADIETLRSLGFQAHVDDKGRLIITQTNVYVLDGTNYLYLTYRRDADELDYYVEYDKSSDAVKHLLA
jgi:hypothetical protein